MRGNEWDPLKELATVQERMNKLFESALARTNFDPGEVGAYSPVADVYETPDALVVHLEVPGMDPARMEVRLEGDELVVSGETHAERETGSEQFHRVERAHGRFARRFPLPSTVDRDDAQASYQAGVLRITVPKREGARRSPIRVSVR